jgi:hypothetical protein
MISSSLRFSVLDGAWAVARLGADEPFPAWALDAPGFVSITRTADEVSVVCREEYVPRDVRAEYGWAAMKIEGPFAFTQVGVLTSFIEPLAAAGVGLFAISTFDTDYVLIKAGQLVHACRALAEASHERMHA